MLYLNLFPSPADLKIMALLPFGFLSVIIINLIFILAWALIKWKYMFLSLLTLLFGIGYISAIVPLPSYFNAKPTEGDIKVMSYNVMLFGFYDWNNNVQIKDSVLSIINCEKPDILCLQEVYWNNDNSDFNPLGEILKTNSNYFIHKETMATAIKGQNFGLATISKYPIVNESYIKFENSFNGVIVSDIVIGEDTIRVFNCHMQSIQLDQNDYTLIETITDTIDNSKLRLVLKKVVQATQQRALQADIVASEIQNSPYSVFVCGDLNDFPLSYTYLKLSKGLRDSYSTKGRFPGYTWDNFGIKQRIDVIFYDKSFSCTKHKVIKKAFSDHYPVVAEFNL